MHWSTKKQIVTCNSPPNYSSLLKTHTLAYWDYVVYGIRVKKQHFLTSREFPAPLVYYTCTPCSGHFLWLRIVMTNETQAIVSQFAALDIRSRKRTEKRGPSIDLVIERKHSEVTVSGARERKRKKSGHFEKISR